MDAADLDQFPLFDGMSDDELALAASLFEPIRRMAGERVTREADFGYSLFLVLKGRVSVNHDGDQIAELGVGDHFGEVSLVTGNKRNATVTALETCELGKIMTWDFQDLLQQHPTLAARIEAVAKDRS